MGKICKKPTLEDIDDGVQNIIDNFSTYNAMELSDIIEAKAENPPRKNSKAYTLWRTEINKVIDLFNNKYGKIYSRKK